MPRFADIRGQDRAHEQLRAAVRGGRYPHAYLFHGTRGVGKTSTGFALAQFLNCENPVPEDSCGACRTCRLIDSLQHPDLHWIFPMPGAKKGDDRFDHINKIQAERRRAGVYSLVYPEAASIGIGREEDTRKGSMGELRHEASMFAVESRVKVFVVSDAQRMPEEAQNSLLKVLEEPRPDNLIILCTHRPGEIRDTIVSRCQNVRFRDLPEEEIVSLLLERGVTPETKTKTKTKKKTTRAKKKGAEETDAEEDDASPSSPVVLTPEQAALAAGLARGSLTRAAELASGDDVQARRDDALAFLHARASDDVLHGLIRSMSGPGGAKNRVAVEYIMDVGGLWTADLLRVVSGSRVPLVNRDREAELKREAVGLTLEEIRRRAHVLGEARRALHGNVYLPLLLYNLARGYASPPEPVGARGRA